MPRSLVAVVSSGHIAPVNRLLDLDTRPVIAHRGASGHAPENTLKAFRVAAEMGADAIELDVRLSADGVPVVIHDRRLNRTTNLRGRVRAMTAAALGRADAGAGEHVPTLAEVLDAVPHMPLMIEIKEPDAQRAVRELVLARGDAGRVAIASEHAEALAAFADGAIAIGASSDHIGRLYFGALLRRQSGAVPYRFLSVPVRHRGLPVATRGFIAAARALGCPVHVWTVNDGAAARRLWARGAAGIVTNYPDRVLAAR
jgi:glycerophosphoryl diester phosphodiesterase